MKPHRSLQLPVVPWLAPVTGLTPRVNGLPRFDKPPLVYWLMGLGYSIPANELWDPLGTWAGRLPSALASVATMLMLGDTLMVHPAENDNHPRRTAVAAALAFALSPLVQLWSRTAVSDPLLRRHPRSEPPLPVALFMPVERLDDGGSPGFCSPQPCSRKGLWPWSSVA